MLGPRKLVAAGQCWAAWQVAQKLAIRDLSSTYLSSHRPRIYANQFGHLVIRAPLPSIRERARHFSKKTCHILCGHYPANLAMVFGGGP